MSETPKDAKGIFLAAVDIQDAAEQAAFLERFCNGDPALRQRVEDLLRAYGQPDGPLDKLAAAIAPTVLGEPIREQVGTSIGPYKLMEQIGEGGFGLVFVAEQQQPIRRKVALKIIKPGMDTSDVIGRFEAERQALALMDHPNIAKVLDAGTTESARPYFVMELVRGIPITDYCDQNQLTPRERLELFVPVCNAIQHAHTKGIIHRDVKPSNVLVTLHDGNPVVKVIDFGVAKALHQSLTDKTIYTRFAQMLGTPLYMSPEQAQMSGLDIDTRTDVYSLGVLLYELLTGMTPFDKQRLAKAAYDELLKIIREEEPPKPSLRLSHSSGSLPSIAAQRKTEPAKLSKIFHGDLDWITMKALEKDRTRRYETANGFAADVLRYLNDEAVEAGPPSVRYRLRKLVRKHRTAVVTAGAFALLLLGAVVLTTWLAIRERAARESADTNASIAHDEANRATAALLIADRERQAAIEAKSESDRYAADAKRQATRADLAREDAVRQRKEAQSQQARAEAALSQSEWRLYGSQAAASQLEWGQGKPELALQRLHASRAELRGFEYAYLSSLYSRYHKAVYLDEANRIDALGFNTDGKAVTVIGDQTSGEFNVTRWNLFDATEDRKPGGALQIDASNQIEKRIAFNPDQRSFGWTPGSFAILWNTVTNKIETKVEGIAGSLLHVASLPQGKLRVTCAAERDWNQIKWKWKSGPTVTVSDASGRVLHTIENVFDTDCRKPYAFTWDASQLVAAGKEGNVSVWDVATARQSSQFKTGGKIDFVAVSARGKWIVTTRDDGTMHVWDGKTGRNVLSFKGQAKGWAVHLAFSPDERLLAIRTESGFSLWRLADAKEMFELDLPPMKRLLFLFSSDSKLIATESPSDEHAIRLWDALDVDHATYGMFAKPKGSALCDLKYQGARPFNAWFSPDGRWFACTTTSNPHLKACLQWWDVSTALRDRELQGFVGDRVSGIALGPGSRNLAKGYGDGTIKLFDVQTGEQKETWKAGNDELTCQAFGRGDELLATGGKDRSITLWDPQAKRQIRRLRRRLRPVLDLTFAEQYLEAEYPRGRFLGFDPDTEGKDGETSLGWSFSETPLHQESFAYNPARKLRAKAEAHGFRGDVKHVLKIWNDTVDTSCSGHADTISSLSFRADGKRIASGSWDHTVRIWSVDDGKQVAQCTGHTGRIYSVAFRPDGKRMIGAGEDKTVRFWDPETGQEAQVLRRHSAAVNCVAYQPNGRTFVTAADDKSVRLWDDGTGNEIALLDGHTAAVHVVAFSPDGTKIASASDDTTVIIWETSSHKKLLTLRGHQDPVRSMLFLPDGKRLVTGSWDATVRIWDLATGKEVLIKDCVDSAETLVFSVDGKRLTGVGDSWIQTWDVPSGREVLALRRRQTEGLVQRNSHDAGVDQLYAVSSDGEWIFDGEAVWATDRGKKISALHGISSRVHWADFNSDGKYLATAKKNVVTVWNARTGERRSVLKGHTEPVYGASFNADATRVATASEDNTVVIWDAATGNRLRVLAGHTDAVNAVTFSPDGERLASVGEDDVARIWEPNSGAELCAIPILGFNTPMPGQIRHIPNRCTDVRFSSDGNWVVVGSNSQKRMIRGTFDPEDLNGIAWDIAARPDAGRDAYQHALRYAQKADRLAPNDPNTLNTLGAAQYRVGEYAEALATLERSHRLYAESKSEPILGDLAFLAMAHHTLKQTTEAQELFRQMTALFKQGQWKDDDEAKKLYEEAGRQLSTAP